MVTHGGTVVAAFSFLYSYMWCRFKPIVLKITHNNDKLSSNPDFDQIQILITTRTKFAFIAFYWLLAVACFQTVFI